MRANSDKLQTFPLGMNVLFAVTLHDNIGRTFAVASIPLKYRLNRRVEIIITQRKINTCSEECSASGKDWEYLAGFCVDNSELCVIHCQMDFFFYENINNTAIDIKQPLQLSKTKLAEHNKAIYYEKRNKN